MLRGDGRRTVRAGGSARRRAHALRIDHPLPTAEPSRAAQCLRVAKSPPLRRLDLFGQHLALEARVPSRKGIVAHDDDDLGLDRFERGGHRAGAG